MNSAVPFIVHGCCGALLACLIAISVLGGLDSGPLIAMCAVLGFVLGGFAGPRGLQFLADVFRHS